MRRHSQRGASSVEMALVGIPVMFVLISIFEMSRGMWMYHTLAYAAKEGVRFASVHGVDCGTVGPVANTCTKTVAQVAQVIQDAGVGLDPNTTSVKLISGPSTIICDLGRPTGCPSNSAPWPPDGANGVGQTIEIDIVTPFNSALAMFWPGSKVVSFAVVKLGASSSDRIQF